MVFIAVITGANEGDFARFMVDPDPRHVIHTDFVNQGNLPVSNADPC
jgi:hypothetical protein